MIERKEKRFKAELVAKKLRTLRVENHLLVEQVALLAGVTTTSIRSYEAGTTFPNVPRLVKLANFYDVSLDYFFTEEEQQATTKLAE